MSKLLAILFLLLILALGTFFRFYQITEIPPGLYSDEAMNGNNALEAIATGDFKIFYPENNGREGLFINLQALSLWFFGNESWALRIVSALFGTLTILGVYLLTKELLLKSHFNKGQSSTSIALLSSFFLATSFWHINFSRIGFRAIMVPFFATFGTYFLLKGLREKKILPIIAAGLAVGLGFHTYIAFRFMPFVLAVPLGWYLWNWIKKYEKKCIPCLAALFLFTTFVAALPMGIYFLQNPQDFLGRAGDVSIFSAVSPLKEFAKSNLATLGMFFVQGDCNWRHNFNCQPFLTQGILLIVTLAILIGGSRKKPEYRFPLYMLGGWLFFMSLPATLTKEGLPHALRSIGMIPPVLILSGFGSWWIYQKIIEWLEKQKNKWPEKINQLERIKKEILILSALALILLPIMTYRQYFIRWAQNENTYFAFSTDIWHMGKYINNLPQDTKKYIIVDSPDVNIQEIPISAQTIMFATDTFKEKARSDKNIFYLTPESMRHRVFNKEENLVLAFLNGVDRNLILSIQKKYPELKVKVPGDFVILEN